MRVDDTVVDQYRRDTMERGAVLMGLVGSIGVVVA